jgi:hypothetical protein
MPKLPSRKTRVIWRKLNCLDPMFPECNKLTAATASASSAIRSRVQTHRGPRTFRLMGDGE